MPSPQALTLRAWTRKDSAAIAVVTVLGGVLRGLRLSTPHRLYFDEVYYGKAACVFVQRPRSCGISLDTRADLIPEHPPLGKWLIGVGIRVFGFSPFGWRIIALLFGTVSIVVVYLLARRVLRTTLGATIASGLLAIDFLHLVHSRIAMLDVFVTFFGLTAFLFLAYDRDGLLNRGPRGRHREGGSLLGRPWRLAAGAAAGAAAASKWEGWFVLLALIGLSLLWEVEARKRSGPGAVRAVLGAEWSSLLIAMVLVPIAVYVVSYAGVIQGSIFTAPWKSGSWARALVGRQKYMLHYHLSLSATHPYTSPPWSWLLLKRPVAYFFELLPTGYREVLAVGSPLVWWASVPALLYVGWSWIRKRDWAGPEGIILVGFVATYGPWLVAPERHVTFLFYLLPGVPFMCLALGYVAERLTSSTAGRTGVALFAAGSVLLFAFYYPVLTAMPLSRPAWEARLLFHNCAGAGATTSTPHPGDPQGTMRLPNLGAGRPPLGWCWI